MRGHMALDEQNALFRVEPAGNVLRDQLERLHGGASAGSCRTVMAC